MPWVRFEDDYLGSKKVSLMSTAAIALDMAGIIYSGQHLRDGHLTSRDVGVVSAQIAIKRPEPVLAELVRVGRWEPEADGAYGIHDYLEYQPSRAQVLAQRRADSARKSGRIPAGKQGDSGRIPAAPYPYPYPDPVPEGPGGSLTTSPRPAHARGQAQAPPHAADVPPMLHPEVHQCPLCRQTFEGDYLEHTAVAHKVRAEPDDLSRPKRRRRQREPTPKEIYQELDAMTPLKDIIVPPDIQAEHERLLARERAINGTE